MAQRPAESIVQARAGLTPDEDDAPTTKKDAGTEAAKASLGITLQPLTAQLREQLHVAGHGQGGRYCRDQPVERCG